MNLKEMWKEYMKIYNKGGKLWDKGDKLWGFDEANKLWDKAREVWLKADAILEDFVEENYEEEVTILYEDMDGRITLSNGVILYHDGRIYEPLEAVMRRIIKEHEEEGE